MRTGSLWVAAILLTAAAATSGGLFQAPRPGADLEPVDGAASVIQLLQGSESILWTTLEGTVTLYTAIGWPTSQPDAELGGALVMRRPLDGSAGVIDFGGKPKSLSFELSG